MFVVLVKRILKLLGVSIDPLGPLALFGAAKDPALHVLSFHHEHPIPGDDDVVDLSGSVFRRQGDILDKVVVIFVEEQASGGVYNEFAQLTFEPGRT